MGNYELKFIRYRSEGRVLHLSDFRKNNPAFRVRILHTGRRQCRPSGLLQFVPGRFPDLDLRGNYSAGFDVSYSNNPANRCPLVSCPAAVPPLFFHTRRPIVHTAALFHSPPSGRFAFSAPVTLGVV